MDSETTDTEEFNGEKQLGFMKIIEKFPILLNKSQIPSIKAKKEKAFKEAIEKIKEMIGQEFDVKGLGKKISRMKADVKSKIDMNRTGNKKIHLKAWEKVMADLLGRDSNPSILKVPVSLF